MGCCIREVQSCSCTKVQHDVKRVVLRRRRQNRTFSADFVREGLDGSLELELGSLSAMTRIGVVVGHCVEQLDVDTTITWTTAVNFLLSFLSLVYPRRVLGFLVLYVFSVIRSPCCKFVNDVA